MAGSFSAAEECTDSYGMWMGAGIGARTCGQQSRATLVLAMLLVVALGADAQTNYTVLRSFGFPDQAGMYPDILVEGSDGALYGSAIVGQQQFWFGSPDNPQRSIVFKMQKDGGGYAVLHRFADTNATVSDLICGTNGVLYGTTFSSGTSSNRGTLFKLNQDGTGYVVLHEFGGSPIGDGEAPRGLRQARDGVLYGVTSHGGVTNNCPKGCGIAFRLDLDGSGYAIIRNLGEIPSDGKYPMAALMEGSDGQLYGTASQGGAGNAGTVFKLSKDGSGYTNVLSFVGTNGRSPVAALIQGSDGALYGNTQLGGYFNGGVVFRMNTDGSSYQVFHEFAGGPTDGFGPSTPLVEATNGAIYGSTPLGHQSYGYRRAEGTIFRIDKDGSGYQLLTNRIILRPRLVRTSDGTFYGSHSRAVFKFVKDMTDYETVRYFDRGGGDGEVPKWLIECSDGLLYGLTWGPYHSSGGGTIFRIRKDGTGYTTIFNFRNDLMNIDFPHGLLEGTDGRLYGASASGGSFNIGAIFRLNKDGSDFIIITSFDGTNGIGPTEGLIQGSDGCLYGTTGGGGTYGKGTIFKVQQDGSGLTALHHFHGSPADNTDGGHPNTGLLEGSDGWLYGVSHLFGIAEQGTVFKLRKDGSDYHQLFGFPDLGSHNQGPCSPLIEGSDGALYGPTRGGGSEQGGVLFSLNKDGAGYGVVLNFKSGFFNDIRRVIEGTDGVLYGLTLMGGSADQGMLFKVRRDGTGYAVLHDFTNTSGDGGGAWGPMIEGSDGAIYGVTQWGGHVNVGTLFRYVPPPEVSMQRQMGGNVRIMARALSRNALAIEASTDLTAWAEIASGIVTNGWFMTDDLQASQFDYRFYRARLR